MSACEVKAHLIVCRQYLYWRRLFLAVFGLKLVVVADLRDSRVIGLNIKLQLYTVVVVLTAILCQ